MFVDGSTCNASEESGAMWSREDICDALDTRGVPDELLSAWTSQEEAWRSWEGCNASSPVPFHEVREVALRFLHRTLIISGLDHMSLFDAAMLLDLYLMKAQAPEIMTVLPATCAAVTRLVLKVGLGPRAMKDIPFDVASDVGSFAMWLGAAGFDQVVCTEAEAADVIDSQEADILETLDWQVKFPTSEAWISVFFSRFDVLTQSRYAQALTYARQFSISAAGFMMRKRALDRDMPPKRAAVGLVCLSLASVGFASFDSLRPSSLGSEQWTQVLWEAGFDWRKLERTPRREHHSAMPTFLTRAIGEDRARISEHCHAVALAMRCVAQGNESVSSAYVARV